MTRQVMIATISENNSSPRIMPNLSIVLVCWNNKDYLEPCLQSLYSAEVNYSFDTVVVDNGSTDGSKEMLRKQFPEIKIIQNDHNVGLARACNQGIEATRGSFILLLNNDTLVNGPSLESMIAFMEMTPDAGAVGGKLLNLDGSFQGGYANFTSLMEEFLVTSRIGERLWEGYPTHFGQAADEPIQVGWISSACLLLRRAALDEVGLLDEEFFIYGDEVDLQYRLQRNGWNIYYLPDATTLHYGGRSMNRWRRRQMVYRGKMLFYQKNYGPFRTSLLRIMFAFTSVLKIFSWIVPYLLPGQRERARQEINSNLEIFNMCFHRGVVQPS